MSARSTHPLRALALTLALTLTLTITLALRQPTASAHPVTFQGGTAFALMSQGDMTLWEANHSLSRAVAIGADYLRLGDKERLGFARANLLVHRWLGEGSQGNLYLLGGVGGGERGGAPGWAWLGGVQADYETPHLYTALMARAVGGPSLSPGDLGYQALYRAGFAPYVAPADGLQSWLVFQVSRDSSMSGPLTVTALMRMFYRQALWEIGADTEGRPWLHLMTHF